MDVVVSTSSKMWTCVPNLDNVQQAVWTNQDWDFWLVSDSNQKLRDKTGNGMIQKKWSGHMWSSDFGHILVLNWFKCELRLVKVQPSLVPGKVNPDTSGNKDKQLQHHTYLSSAVPSNFSNGLYWFLLVSSGLAWTDPLYRVWLAYWSGTGLAWFWLLVLVQPEVPGSCVSGWVLIGSLSELFLVDCCNPVISTFSSRWSSFWRCCSSSCRMSRIHSRWSRFTVNGEVVFVV